MEQSSSEISSSVQQECSLQQKEAKNSYSKEKSILDIIKTNSSFAKKYQINSDKYQDDQSDFSQSQKNWISLKGVDNQTNEFVTLKISLQNKLSYELLKKESIMLQNLQINCDSYISYLDSFDILEDNIYILVLEHYDKSLADIIEEKKKYDTQFSEKEIVCISYSCVNSLLELHQQNVSLNNINANSIIVDHKGNYKFKDFIDPSLLKDYYQNEDQKELTPYLIQCDIQTLISSPDEAKDERSQQSDVYCFGLLLLSLMGFDINDSTNSNLIANQEFFQAMHLIQAEFQNVYSFVCLYMLNRDAQLRYLSSQLKKLMLKYYESVYFSNEEALENMRKRIKIYTDKQLPIDEYYVYLICIFIQFDKKNELDDSVFIKAIHSFEEFEKNNFRTANLLHEIGNTYLRKKLYDSAIEYLDRGKQIKEQEGSFHQILFSLINNIGNCYIYKKDFNKALSYYEDTIEKREKYYGPDHGLIAESERNRGICYSFMTKFDKAINSQLKVLTIREKWFKGDHYLIAESCQDLGEYNQNQNQDELAKEYKEKALSISKNLYKFPSKQLSDSTNNLGVYLYKLIKYEEALEYFFEALSGYEKVYGKESIENVIFVRNIGHCYRMLKRYQDSLTYYERTLQIKRNHYKTKHSSFADSISDIVTVYSFMGESDSQFKYLLELIELCVEFKINNSSYFQSMVNFLLRIKNLQKKLQHLLFVWKKFKTTTHSQILFQQQILTTIIWIYELTDQEAAEEYKLQLVLHQLENI